VFFPPKTIGSGFWPRTPLERHPSWANTLLFSGRFVGFLFSRRIEALMVRDLEREVFPDEPRLFANTLPPPHKCKNGFLLGRAPFYKKECFQRSEQTFFLRRNTIFPFIGGSIPAPPSRPPVLSFERGVTPLVLKGPFERKSAPQEGVTKGKNFFFGFF